MRHTTAVIAACASALAALVAGTCLADWPGHRPKMIGTNHSAPIAWAFVDVERVGSSDSLGLGIWVGSDLPLTTARWKVVLPPGLTFLSGELGGTELVRGDRSNHKYTRAYVRCERLGDFRIHYNIRAAKDSTNWSSMESAVLVHITPDSFASGETLSDRLRRIVVDGVHYRSQYLKLIPLDPGEDERVGPEVAESVSLQPAPVIHRESAIRASSAAGDSTVEVPVWVVVDRTGRVKAVEPTTGPAAAAAWKWTFTPAQSLGRPVSMLYLIRVPVATTAGK